MGREPLEPLLVDGTLAPVFEHRCAEVVVYHGARDASYTLEEPDVPFEKTFKVLPGVCSDIYVPTSAQPEAEQVRPGPFSAQIECSLSPVHLGGFTQRKVQRHVCLARFVAQEVHPPSDGGLAPGEALFLHEPFVYAPRRVALLL
jgi:hypothetical protein